MILFLTCSINLKNMNVIFRKLKICRTLISFSFLTYLKKLRKFLIVLLRLQICKETFGRPFCREFWEICRSRDRENRAAPIERRRDESRSKFDARLLSKRACDVRAYGFDEPRASISVLFSRYSSLRALQGSGKNQSRTMAPTRKTPVTAVSWKSSTRYWKLCGKYCEWCGWSRRGRFGSSW